MAGGVNQVDDATCFFGFLLLLDEHNVFLHVEEERDGGGGDAIFLLILSCVCDAGLASIRRSDDTSFGH